MSSSKSPSPVGTHAPQFSVQTLFVVITLVSICLAVWVWGAGTLLWIVALVPLAEAARWGWSKWFVVGYAAVGAFVAMLIMGPMVPRTNDRSYEQRRMCNNHLRNIGVALRMYELAHGSFPPIATYDDSGRPMHSWRTLLLPHIEREDLAESYDMNQPWDGPTNSRLQFAYIPPFQCPSDPGRNIGWVSYVAVVVPGAKPGERFAVIELPETGIKFSEPRDVSLAELTTKSPPRGLHHNLERMHVLWPDGRVEYVPVSELAEKLAPLQPVQSSPSAPK